MLVGFIIPLCSVMGSLQATHDDRRALALIKAEDALAGFGGVHPLRDHERDERVVVVHENFLALHGGHTDDGRVVSVEEDRSRAGEAFFYGCVVDHGVLQSIHPSVGFAKFPLLHTNHP